MKLALSICMIINANNTFNISFKKFILSLDDLKTCITIPHGKPAKEFLEFLDELPDVKNVKAFVFTTSGKGTEKYNIPLKEKLEEKGFEVVGEFS